MIKFIFVLAVGAALSSCGTSTPSCESSDPRSIVKALDAQGLLSTSVMDLAPNTIAELKARSNDQTGFVERFETAIGKVINLDNPDLEEALVAGYSKVDPAALSAMCDALNGKDEETIRKVNAQLAPILGPEAMPILEAAGDDLLRALDHTKAGE